MDTLEKRMLEMELSGRRRRTQRRFVDVVKDDMEMVGVTVEEAGDMGRGEMEAGDPLWRRLEGENLRGISHGDVTALTCRFLISLTLLGKKNYTWGGVSLKENCVDAEPCHGLKFTNVLQESHWLLPVK